MSFTEWIVKSFPFPFTQSWVTKADKLQRKVQIKNKPQYFKKQFMQLFIFVSFMVDFF